MHAELWCPSSPLAWSCSPQSCPLCTVGLLCSEHLLTSRLPLGKLPILVLVQLSCCFQLLGCTCVPLSNCVAFCWAGSASRTFWLAIGVNKWVGVGTRSHNLIQIKQTMAPDAKKGGCGGDELKTIFSSCYIQVMWLVPEICVWMKQLLFYEENAATFQDLQQILAEEKWRRRNL